MAFSAFIVDVLFHLDVRVVQKETQMICAGDELAASTLPRVLHGGHLVRWNHWQPARPHDQ